MTASVDHMSSETVDLKRNIPLTPAEIHLWLAFSDEITEERLDSTYRELLDAAEKEQELRFHFASDQRRYLITRALVRTVLSRYVSIHPREWVFTANAYGRPEIVNVQAKDVSLVFNIAHTHGLIVLAVTKRRSLGVDVENFRARDVSIDIADRYFAPQEIAILAAVPAHQRKYRFFEYWTFKEAYIKARGMGLSLPLDKISFHYPDDHGVEITIDPELADDSARWQFWQFRPRAEYLVAICAERVDSQAPRLVVRRVIPMLSETRFAHTLLRASA